MTYLLRHIWYSPYCSLATNVDSMLLNTIASYNTEVFVYLVIAKHTKGTVQIQHKR